MSELVELRDIARSDIARQRREHLAHRDADPLGLDPVDLHKELRRACPECRGEPLKRRLGIAIRDDGVGQALKHGVVEIAVFELDLHGEAADVADALNWRRRERECERFRHALQGAVESQGDRAGVLSRLLEAHVPILEDDEGDAGVGEARQVVEDGDAADGDHMLDAGDFAWRFLGSFA